MTKASSYVLGISGDSVLDLLKTPLKGFSMSRELSTIQKGTSVDFIAAYLPGMLRHSRTAIVKGIC